MFTVLVVLLLISSSVLGVEYPSTINVVVAPPQPQVTPIFKPWHFNRVDCVLADLVPKVSQRIKLLKKCQDEFVLNEQLKPSSGRKNPYLGWRYTPIIGVWHMENDRESKETNDPPQFPSEIRRFTESLYKNLDEISRNTVYSISDNIAISPLAIEMVLASLLIGAKYDTKKEISRFIDVTLEGLPLKYHSILHQLQLKRQSSIRLLTQLYLEESFFPVKDDFNRQLYEIFDTRIQSANFHAGAPAELEKLNHFVAENTGGHVIDAFTPDVLNEHTQLLLVNTLYFKSMWENQFQISYGFNGDFLLPDGKSTKVTYMSREAIYYNYKKNKIGHYKMLELPFLSETNDPGLYSMIIILPDKKNSLEDVEKYITKDDSWLKDFDLVSSKDTDIVKPIIPRFTIDSKANLKNALNKMNVFLMFEENSDFGNISEQKNIKTSKIYQRIYLDVNEKGANVSPRETHLPGTAQESQRALKFHAKHPFMFAIVQRVTKSVLLMGRVIKPNFDELFAKNSEDIEN